MNDTLSFPLDRLIYGGSFDPPHKGHFEIMKWVLTKNYTDSLDIVPANISPFKTDAPPIASGFRLNMLDIGIKEEISLELRERIRVIDYELNRAPPSYTCDTCVEIKGEFPKMRIGLLIGSDSLAGLENWRDIETLLQNHPILIFVRAGYGPEMCEKIVSHLKNKFAAAHPRFYLLNNPLIDCSSVSLRLMLTDFETNSELRSELKNCMPQSVLRFIVNNRIYGVK